MPKYPIAAALLATGACGEAAPIASLSVPPPPPGIPAVSVMPNGQVLQLGDSLRFVALTNVGAITAFAWTVDRADLTSVDSLGMLRSLKAGVVTVRACSNAPPILCGSATLTVQ